MGACNQATHQEGSHHDVTGLAGHDGLGLTLPF